LSQKDKTPTKTTYALRIYLMIAFVEGSAVMIAELLGAKMVAPFYGTSLFVWSSVIGVTLAALAAGYFSGGYLADRYTGNALLFTVLAVGSALIALMPFSARAIMEATLGMGVRGGSLVSTLTFLFPPLLCMGMVSPIIIRLGSSDVQHTGRTAGSVYATSTFGGILSTFAAGFYAIPTFGITLPVFVAAGVLGLFPFSYFLSRKKYPRAAFLLIIVVGLFLGSRFQKIDPRVVYHSEGLLGQVIVSDFKTAAEDSLQLRRILYVNRLPQSIEILHTGFSPWPYVHGIATMASIKPPGSKALILGLGGGSIADEFLRLGFEVEGCELDERIAFVAKKYFYPSHNFPVYVDDARHFIRTTDRRYDIIVIDVFAGEQQPPHVLTLESFQEVRALLSRDGLVLINFTGFLSGDKGLASRSIVRTLVEAGFDVRFLPTPGSEETRNLLIVASPSSLDFSSLSPARQNVCCKEVSGVPIPLPLMRPQQIQLSDAPILRDNRPIMELINLPANESWRKAVIKGYGEQFKGAPFF
jgi:predicted membrane-bound spermidine synthase